MLDPCEPRAARQSGRGARMSDAAERGGAPAEARRAGRRQMSLMQVFRAAARNRDGRRVVPGDGAAGGGLAGADTDMTRRSQQRREGSSETALRADLAQDVANLMNTIRLDAMVDLAEVPWVRRSVVNYGFQDLGGIARSQRTEGEIAGAIREALITHEPRLIPASIEVRLPQGQDASDHRLSFDISAEMIATPADIALDFVAEVDLGAGKIQLQRLKVAG